MAPAPRGQAGMGQGVPGSLLLQPLGAGMGQLGPRGLRTCNTGA